MNKDKISPLLLTLKNWLTQDNIKFEQLPDETSIFRLGLELPNKYKFQVFQPKNKEFLVFHSQLRISPQHKDAMKAMTPKDLDNFLWTLKFRLLMINNAQFALHFEQNTTPPMLDRIDFVSRIFVEDLTRTLFFSYIDAINKGLIIANWTFLQLLGKGGSISEPHDLSFL